MTDTGEDLELALYRQLGLSPSAAGLADPNPSPATRRREATCAPTV
jgi:hypothetical protein